MQVLVGDIGGTKTGLALAAPAGEGIELSAQTRYPSGQFGCLGDIIARYLEATGAHVETAALAVAGPVRDGRSRTTNLPWEIDAGELEGRFGLQRVALLNDLEAVAWGIPALAESDLAVLQPGAADARGNACVVAAGTGLGQAGLFWDGRRHRPFATEGGHCSFAPTTDSREIGLLVHLTKRYGHVSWERVVSGMGIGNIYGFLAEQAKTAHADAVAQALADGGDLAAAVAMTAAAGACPVCADAMDLFACLYGREAGNVALKHMALGGVYLGGGIAPKNLDLLQRSGFLAGFRDKGRMRALMEQIPVRVILDPHTPLRGAARYLDAARALW
jgi:glucokinase